MTHFLVYVVKSSQVDPEGAQVDLESAQVDLETVQVDPESAQVDLTTQVNLKKMPGWTLKAPR